MSASESLKWRKLPVVVEAFRWTADRDQGRDPEWIESAIQSGKVFFRGSNPENVKLVIATLEGHMVADRGDYIIRGVQGELYPCKPDIFAATYEPADAPIYGEAAELRAENERLRAAIREWAAADDEERLARIAWEGYGTPVTLSAVKAAKDRLHRAAEHLRTLAGTDGAE